jgi:hypothetical protein
MHQASRKLVLVMVEQCIRCGEGWSMLRFPEAIIQMWVNGRTGGGDHASHLCHAARRRRWFEGQSDEGVSIAAWPLHPMPCLPRRHVLSEKSPVEYLDSQQRRVTFISDFDLRPVCNRFSCIVTATKPVMPTFIIPETSRQPDRGTYIGRFERLNKVRVRCSLCMCSAAVRRL